MSETYLLVTTNPPLEDVIKHYGVKGMKWGVRRDRDGGGTLSVKYRKTYTKQNSTKEERKEAKVKTVGKRFANAILADRATHAATAATLLGTAASFISDQGGLQDTIDALVGPRSRADLLNPTRDFALEETSGRTMAVGGTGLATSYLLGLRAQVYKPFFNNLVRNPSVRAQVKLSPDEMTRLTSGKDFVKSIHTKDGTVKVSSIKGEKVSSLTNKKGDVVGTRREVAKK